MNNQLQIFNNEQFGQVRTLSIDNEFWFVGKDIAESLGYVKPRNAIATHVDSEDKKGAPIQGDLGGTQEMTVINESGLYSLIFNSKLPNARQFKRWVTSEVLPSIRKTGSYNSEGITKKDVFDLIKSLPEDSLKNKVSDMILERFLPIEKKQIISNGLNLKALLDEFLQDETVILRQTDYGLAVDKQKLYSFFSNYGFTRTETLRRLDNENLLFTEDDCRSVKVYIPDVRKTMRVVVVKE